MVEDVATDTVRLAILRKIKALYMASTSDPEPPTGKINYGIAFGLVKLGPLGAVDQRKMFSIGIVPGIEKKSDLFPLKTCILPITIEFRAVHDMKSLEDSQELGEKVLGVVQQIFMDDDKLSGTVIQSQEEANEVTLTTYADRTIEGYVTFNVHYRHHAQSVYNPNPSA